MHSPGMIEIQLDEGLLTSALIQSVSARKIRLFAREGFQDEAHLFQSLPAAWRRACGAAEQLLREIEALEGSVAPSLAIRKTNDAVRQFTYDATEVFDLYAQLLPSRLRIDRTKAESSAIALFQKTADRLRKPTAVLCNKFKHGNRQLIGGRMVSQFSPDCTFVFGVVQFTSGDSLLTDAQVHGHGARFISYRKWLAEALHHLLRVDRQSAMLVTGLSDNQTSANPTFRLELNLLSVLKALQAPIFTAQPEPPMYDAVEVRENAVRLVRTRSQPIREPSHRTTMISADGLTRTFSFL